jgi:hypothetical protein
MIRAARSGLFFNDLLPRRALRESGVRAALAADLAGAFNG